jgi:glycosyltransferase involved in cell wall biosynthesis
VKIPSLAVLIPAYNEGATIVQVVEAFQQILPEARVHVYDNNSNDRTAELARTAGAIVCHESRQGKGHVIRRMFADVEADVYVLVDGDDTYDAASARSLCDRLLADGLDMVIANRLGVDVTAFRQGHFFGNRMLSGFVALLFGKPVTDMLSGYRVLSRRCVKSFPALSGGFEIETELTIHSLELDMPVGEVFTPYRARPEGSQSKLSTFRDGARILRTILLLYKDKRPLRFFFAWFLVLFFTSFLMGYPVIVEFLETGLVPRFPTAIAASGVMILAFISLACGLILDTVSRAEREAKRLRYLAIPAPRG